MSIRSIRIVEQNRFRAEVNSNLEPWLIANVCEPVLHWLPERVHPNAISLFNHVVCWLTLAFAAGSVHLSPNGRFVALFAAGIGVFVAMLADCLDGMQARRTNRCSKVGELLDHWLDAINVPVLFIGISLALKLDPWMVVVVHISGTMIYNAQLVFYHHSGRFIHPPTSGADGQFGMSIGYIAMAFIFYLVDRENFWLDMLISGTAVLCMYTNLRLNFFYYLKPSFTFRNHLPLVLMSAGFGALYLLGIIGSMSFVLGVIFISFRLTGSFVLFTIVKRRFNGNDWGIAVWIAIIALGHYAIEPIPLGKTTLQYYFPALACAYMVIRNLYDLAFYMPMLKENAQPAK